tara:strand:- start:3303 stop:4862 length:1560 start_codon:yes stop_codon:yes gene_type:complete
MLGRKPSGTTLAGGFENASAQIASPPLPVVATGALSLSASRWLTLRKEIDATTPVREVLRRSLSGGDAPVGRTFPSDLAPKRLDHSVDAPTTPALRGEPKPSGTNARTSAANGTPERDEAPTLTSTLSSENVSPVKQPFVNSPEKQPGIISPTTQPRARLFQTPLDTQKDTFQALTAKLAAMETQSVAARNECLEGSSREEETRLKLQRAEKSVTDLASRVRFLKAHVLSCQASRNAAIAEENAALARRASGTDASPEKEKNSVAAALYVDLELLSEELRVTKKALVDVEQNKVELELKALQAEAYNKKNFDGKSVSSGGRVSGRGDAVRGVQKKSEALDELIRAELLDTKTELALVDASLRVTNQKVKTLLDAAAATSGDFLESVVESLENDTQKPRAALDDAKAGNKKFGDTEAGTSTEPVKRRGKASRLFFVFAVAPLIIVCAAALGVVWFHRRELELRNAFRNNKSAETDTNDSRCSPWGVLHQMLDELLSGTTGVVFTVNPGMCGANALHVPAT